MKLKSILSNKLHEYFYKRKAENFALIVIVVLIFIGSFLRIYGIKHVYTEYDDVGVVAIHKAHIGFKEINPIEGLIDYPIKVDMESAHSIENNFLLPFYIAYTWTYAPAQYILFPILLEEDDKFDEVLLKGRLVSAFFSIAGLCLLAYLMYAISGHQLNWVIPLVLVIPTFSANSILYAHHMSPYSAYFFSTALSLFLLFQYFFSKISFRQIVISLSILIYLSYLTVLFALPVLLIYLFKYRFNKNLAKAINFSRDFITIFIGFSISLPAALVIKSSSGGKGLMPPEYSGLESLKDFFHHFINQFFLSIESIIYGSIRNEYIFILLAFMLGFILIKRIFSSSKRFNIALSYLIAIASIVFQWIVLHLFGILPLDETRHMLIVLPIVTIIIFYLLKNFELLKKSIFVFPIIALITYSASIYSLNLIESKYSNFNYEFLNDRSEKVILLYRSTLGPLKYFENSEKEVYFIDMNSFQNNYLNMEFPDEILLVSQQTEIYNEGLLKKYKDLLPKLFCNYEINSLYEKDSETYFTYSNYSANSNKNGMFVYQMKKTKKNKC